MILWVDASYRDGRAGVAVADEAGRLLSGYVGFFRSSHEAEEAAIELGLRQRDTLGSGDVRTDHMALARRFAGFGVVHGDRGDNTAHTHARRVLREHPDHPR